MFLRLCEKITVEQGVEPFKISPGSSSGLRNLIFNGSVPVQVQDFSKIWVQIRFGFSCTKI